MYIVPFSILLIIAEDVTVASAEAVGAKDGVAETTALGVGVTFSVAFGVSIGAVIGFSVTGILLAFGVAVDCKGIAVTATSVGIGVAVFAAFVGSKEEIGVLLTAGVHVVSVAVCTGVPVMAGEVAGVVVVIAVFVGVGVLLSATIQRMVAVFPLKVFAKCQ